MKKIFLIFIFITALVLTGLSVQAKNNLLHSITLEKGSTGYNVILNTDKITKVVRRVNSNNELVLELSDIASSDTVNALYKGTSNIENLVIENNEPNKLKIYITAPDINNSSVIVEPEDGVTTIAGESFPLDRALWCGFVLLLFAGIFKAAKKISEQESKIMIRQDIKDREIEMYRHYKKNFGTSMNLKSAQDRKLKSMLKKIDRKIDERLTAIR